MKLGLKRNSKRRCYQVAIDGCLSISSAVISCSRSVGRPRTNIMEIRRISWWSPESSEYLPIFCHIFVPGYWAPSLFVPKLFTAPGYICFLYLNSPFVCWNSFSFFVSNSFRAAIFVFAWALFEVKLSYLYFCGKSCCCFWNT